ncbi:uncharacterized protein I303_103726 [Kwoniella dejecticola CBS 10117]|uniref:Cytidyltransferase-like domain-containing protein n=1 Tax=Kwoniella dejecticola CBS 10117 TaxID=1296121 RepID=A0A1A6A7J4_9TREE|nr:uncharacterized protein I303_03743 [Kwoniella dejecticola CBS 10117]OBR86026.1 hypothetical protein I303_03743 [Kwoniella dejecticola CBS 10117]
MIPLRDHSILLAPFTPEILLDPSGVVSTLLDVLPKSSLKSFTVLFTTPDPSCSHTSSTSIPHTSSNTSSSSRSCDQLYTLLQESPTSNFAVFQSFLGKIYAGLATAQLSAGRVLMDVEIHFDGESEGEGASFNEKLFRYPGEEYQLLLIDKVPIPTHLLDILSPLPQTALPPLPPPNPSTISGSSDPPPSPSPGHSVVALGGTFDHLHAAHKLLLQSSHFLAQDKIIVGVMSDSLLSSKKHSELVEPFSKRLSEVKAFLRRLGSSSSSALGLNSNPSGKVELDIIEITDAYGPTKYDPNIQALVVSKETLSGGQAVNIARKEANLNQLEIYVVDVIADQSGAGAELVGESDEGRLKELKLGSTGIRRWISEHQ